MEVSCQLRTPAGLPPVLIGYEDQWASVWTRWQGEESLPPRPSCLSNYHILRKSMIFFTAYDDERPID